jgi:hypothetical protein
MIESLASVIAVISFIALNITACNIFNQRTEIYMVSHNWDIFQAALIQWMIVAAAIFVGIVIIFSLVGLIRKRKVDAFLSTSMLWLSCISALIIAFFIKDVGKDIIPPLNSGIQLVATFTKEYISALLGWILTVLGTTAGLIVLLFIIGLLFKKSALYFITIQPNLFDAEDIAAMSLSVHRSVLRALDNTGIDTSKLRLKSKFTGGRRNEEM